MGFILFLVAFFVIAMLLTSNNSQEPFESIKRCDLHKWVIKNKGEDNEYLVCETCGLLGGSDLYEEKDNFKHN